MAGGERPARALRAPGVGEFLSSGSCLLLAGAIWGLFSGWGVGVWDQTEGADHLQGCSLWLAEWAGLSLTRKKNRRIQGVPIEQEDPHVQEGTSQGGASLSPRTTPVPAMSSEEQQSCYSGEGVPGGDGVEGSWTRGREKAEAGAEGACHHLTSGVLLLQLTLLGLAATSPGARGTPCSQGGSPQEALVSSGETAGGRQV